MDMGAQVGDGDGNGDGKLRQTCEYGCALRFGWY